MSVQIKAVSAQITGAMVLAVVMLLSGCGQKGPLYREAPSVVAPVVDQDQQDSGRESGETPAPQPVLQ